MIGECSYTKRKSVKTTKTAYINNVLLKIFTSLTFLFFLFRKRKFGKNGFEPSY